VCFSKKRVQDIGSKHKGTRIDADPLERKENSRWREEGDVLVISVTGNES